MRWILLGAVLAVLLLFPQLLVVLAAIVAAVLAKPVVVAFGLGLTVRARLPRMKRWAR